MDISQQRVSQLRREDREPATRGERRDSRVAPPWAAAARPQSLSHGPGRLGGMDLNQPKPPAGDLRLAAITDIKDFLDHDDGFPLTIADAVESDHWFATTARQLVVQAGSPEALARLTTAVHHDHGFDWDGIDPDLHVLVADLLERLEVVFSFFDDEYRTILWRTLRTLALDPTRPLQRRSKPERIAAAIAWVALSANAAIGRHCRWATADLWHWFEVSPCTDFGRELENCIRRRNVSDDELCKALAYDSRDTVVADSELLHSSRRMELIAQRDRLQRTIDEQRHSSRDRHPITRVDEGIAIRSQPVVVRWATKGVSPEGRASINVALGEGIADMQAWSLSIPDAHRLVEALQIALDEPLSKTGR